MGGAVVALALLIAGAACGSEPAVVETEKQETETIGETSGETTLAYYYKHLPLEGLQANIAAIKRMGYSAGSLERIPQRRLEGERSC